MPQESFKLMHRLDDAIAIDIWKYDIMFKYMLFCMAAEPMAIIKIFRMF